MYKDAVAANLEPLKRCRTGLSGSECLIEAVTASTNVSISEVVANPTIKVRDTKNISHTLLP